MPSSTILFLWPKPTVDIDSFILCISVSGGLNQLAQKEFTRLFQALLTYVKAPNNA